MNKEDVWSCFYGGAINKLVAHFEKTDSDGLQELATELEKKHKEDDGK